MVGTLGVDGPQLDTRQRFASVADHQVPGERVDPFETNVIARRNQGALIGRIGHRSFGQREVDRTVVVQDQEPVLAADHGVLDGVLDPFAARQHTGELGVGIAGVGDEGLAR